MMERLNGSTSGRGLQTLGHYPLSIIQCQGFSCLCFPGVYSLGHHFSFLWCFFPFKSTHQRTSSFLKNEDGWCIFQFKAVFGELKYDEECDWYRRIVFLLSSFSGMTGKKSRPFFFFRTSLLIQASMLSWLTDLHFF